MSDARISEDDLKKIFSNPFYAITISKTLSEDHQPLVSEEQWIKVNAKLINELGAEAWLRQLLDVLKGDYV